MTDTPQPIENSISITDEMKSSYLDYAMSVIVSRALPDVRDGLKPVHRRILYAMIEGGYDWTKPHRKSARIVGDVISNFHPHGDSSIYEAMVRMAQPFSMRLPLVDGQGNFGSVDGDSAAAMRYTESRLARPAEFLLRDIDKDTVNYVSNYDETQLEPSVLPAEYPNILVNGAGGIAVGMATNIPPHNPNEVIDACIALLKNPKLSEEELLQIVTGPDFPTGGLIMGRKGIVDAYKTGRGSIIMRAKASVITHGNDREAIIIDEIPYQVNKALLLERIGELVRDKTIEGISDIRDESDRNGMRVVIEIKRDGSGEVVLNQLYRHSRLQTSFAVNMLAMNNGKPGQMSLLEVLRAFCLFREEVVGKRTRFLLTKARDRAHILAGLLVALASIDKVIQMIRSASTSEAARSALMAENWPAEEVAPFITLIDDLGHEVVDGKYKLSEVQARSILELRLQRLTGMEQAKLADETKELSIKITEYLEILSNKDSLIKVVLNELNEVRERLNSPRQTFISDSIAEQDDEDLIQQEDMVVTVSHRGYIKRVVLSDYRAQRRGGKGRAGMKTRDEDFVTNVFVANTHTPILFFTSKGMVYQLKCYKLPIGSPQSIGKAMVNLLPIEAEEHIQAVMPMPNDKESWDELNILFATSQGSIRRNKLSDFVNIKRNGKIAIKLSENDKLIGVTTCDEDAQILLASNNGKAIRFSISQIRVFKGRDSSGVRGIKLLGNDSVVSMSVIADEKTEYVLSICENGYGKRTKVTDYRETGRGGIGVANIETSERNGSVVASFTVFETDQIMLVTISGQIIRIRINGSDGDNIRITGRKTQGVRLFELTEDEKVVSVAIVREDESENSEKAALPKIINDEGNLLDNEVGDGLEGNREDIQSDDVVS